MTHDDTSSLEIYDEVPYLDEPFVSTHPQTLSSIATLYGLNPAHPESCRMLELGAASGINLIGMAYAYPNSSFVGIDLSKKQVAKGNTQIQQLGLKNISLIHADIQNLPATLGPFDFIAAHGVLSWVPSEICDNIFKVTENLLSENGIAYLSYNTYPGWKARDVLRDLMLFECKNEQSTKDSVAKARLALNLTTHMIAKNENAFTKQLAEEIGAFQNRPDWYFVHEFIATHNNPFYISDIFKKADVNGLQYLCDTELSMNTLHGIEPHAREILLKLRNNLRLFEQYLDVARCKSFRRSLFCKKPIKIDRQNFTRSLQELYVAGRLTGGQIEDVQTTCFRFTHANGGGLEAIDPVLIKSLQNIAASWPEAVSVSSLIQELNEDDKKILLEALIQGVFANILDLRKTSGPASNKLSEVPKVSALARHQAQSSNLVTTLLHETVELSEVEREILLLLKGDISKEQVIEHCQRKFGSSEVILRKIRDGFKNLIAKALVES